MEEIYNYLPPDSPITNYIKLEQARQDRNVELIASENFCSDAIKAAMASCLTNKYAEGYPYVSTTAGLSGRYYGGCLYVDSVEDYCREAWQKVFKTYYHVNVQPHSGSQANCAAYAAVLQPGDTILGMSLDAGGHLTHGSPVNFSGKTYNFISYGLTEEGYINDDEIYDKIIEFHPKAIMIGASAYSRTIDYAHYLALITKAAEASKAYEDTELGRPFFIVDMAHVAGLIAAGLHPSPFGFADIITTTSHKTLRGPRGGLIFCEPRYAKAIDRAIFPGTQGGPLLHVIAAKAICAEEAQTDEFKTYINRVIVNCHYFAKAFIDRGYKVVTNGTDNHLFLIDLRTKFPNLTGLEVQELLDKEGITLNKNCVPGDTRSPKETSGLRLGTAAMTTKGYNMIDFQLLARKIDNIITKYNNEKK